MVMQELDQQNLREALLQDTFDKKADDQPIEEVEKIE
jgi:hypothetical protein